MRGKVWPQQCDHQSKREGWALFNADGLFAIQRLDEPEEVAAELKMDPKKIGKLKTDAEAYEWVAFRALRGSEMHALALYLDGRTVYEKPWVPKALRMLTESSHAKPRKGREKGRGSRVQGA